MNLSGVKENDLVQVDKRGHRFYARVLPTEKGRRSLEIQPICANNSYRLASAREVVAHYRRSKQSVA